jgi:agmatine deiminase
MLVRFGTEESSVMKTINNSTPHKDGFYMPAEFAPHKGSWLLWPERPDNWRLNAGPAQQTFASTAIAISQFEHVTVGATPTQAVRARQMLPPHIAVVELDYDDAWARDTGPVCVVNDRGLVRGVDWEFNSWGAGIFPSWDKDNRVAQRILEYENLDRYKAELVLEGGSILTDGEGTLLTTEECLLNPNRNPGKSKSEVESILVEYLNVDSVVWFKRGIYLDEAGGHIDNLCCFIRPGVVALTWTDDQSNPQYDISSEAYELLSTVRDARGRRLEVHKIYQPAPLYITKQESEEFTHVEHSVVRGAGDRLPASYINFYIANGGIVMPFFGVAQDQSAYQTVCSLFLDRQVVGVPSRELLLGGGATHCIVQQIPSS